MYGGTEHCERYMTHEPWYGMVTEWKERMINQDRWWT